MIKNNPNTIKGLGLILILLTTACDSSSKEKQAVPIAVEKTFTFSRMPSGVCSNQPPSGELVASRIESANSNQQGLYEGPVWIKDALYFSDFNFTEGFPSKVQKLDSSGKMSVFIEDSGTNGLAADAQGHLIAGTHKFKSLSKYNLDTKVRESIATTFNNNVFNSPNDLTITKEGVIYFTDPDYQAKAAPGGQDKTRVYRVATDGTISVVDDTLSNPNGISLSPDEKTLYVVGNQEAGVLRKYDIVDGAPQEGTTIVSGLNVPDGMAVDCAGNIYVTEHVGKQIRVYTPQGEQIANIKVDANVTNVAFGGSENKTLFITGAGAVWKIDLAISGSAY